MQVEIPGIAYGALKDSSFQEEHPDTWGRFELYSISLTRGKGLSIRAELDEDDWRLIRACMLVMVRRLASQPYPVRGLEGNVTMQSLQVAMGRIDDVLMGH